MRNNVIKPIQIDTGKRPRARFNLSHDVNSTAEWGSAQPIVCRMMYPNTKNVCGVESLVRLAPMLAPTFGRVVAKQYHQFVDIEDIFPAFTAFMNGTPYSGGAGEYVPQCVPRIPLCYLSLFVLCGAKFTFYLGSKGSDDDSVAASTFRSNASLFGPFLAGFVSELEFVNNASFTPSGSGVNDLPFNYSGPAFNFVKLLDLNTRNWLKSLSGLNYLTKLLLPTADLNNHCLYSDNMVTFEGADYVIPFFVKVNNEDYVAYACARLSNFGKRIRKVMLGCGYQFNLQSREIVSILPLMATYKAYYDIFGLTAYNNYQDTYLCKLVSRLATEGAAYLDLIVALSNGTSETQVSTVRKLLVNFILSLGDLWFTEDVDYISSHQAHTTLADAPNGVNSYPKYLDVGASSNMDLKSNTGVGSRSYKDASINSNPFSALDVKLLMKLYRWSNVQTVAGKQIADALRAAGFSSYVDSCKSNFIGSSEQMITINDVVSTADTYKREGDTRDGAILGEYGGRGIGYDDSKPLSYETDKFGYWIGLFFIVPKSGYNQGLDQTLIDTERFELYNPQFDALGFQMDSKSVVCEDLPFGEMGYPTSPQSFGLVPRYTEWKVQKNISNGDFSLRSVRNTYLPYCLDKELPVGERLIKFVSDEGGNYQVSLTKTFARTYIPTAGDIWRYLGRYSWIGLYDRMFANFSEEDIYKRFSEYIAQAGNDNLAITERSEDNFLLHFIINLQSYAPMLPVEKSWQTDDDGSFDDSVDKA